MGDETLAEAMSATAARFLAALDEAGAAQARRPFADESARRWIEYRPRPRPGVSLADLDRPARKAAHRLLATALSPHAYAQAMTVLALEEVLDRAEDWHRGRHSDDYRVVVFGEPADDAWSWRFEGHHLSVSMAVAAGRVSPAPLFLGANPAQVRHAGRVVLRPLAAEEDLAHELLAALSPRALALAVVSDEAPADIHSAVAPRAPRRIEPVGVPAADLPARPRAALERLLAFHLDRLPGELAGRENARLDRRELFFAWAGPPRPGTAHYYRLQGPDLLIEYDNTSADGNHAHTVLRRPLGEFGDDLLGAHRAAAHHPGGHGPAPGAPDRDGPGA